MTLKLPESYADSLTLTGSTTLVGAANGSRIAPSTEGESAIVINGTVMLTVKGSITRRRGHWRRRHRGPFRLQFGAHRRYADRPRKWRDRRRK